MSKHTLLLVFGIFLAGTVYSQTNLAPAIKWEELEQRMKPGAPDSTVVINFWATWCKPCIEEMPCVITAYNHVEKAKIRFLLVSLDFAKDRETKLIPFLEKRQWPIPVVLLNETDYNSWIPRVDKSWEGNIPATLILHGNGKRQFIGKELLPGELEHALGLP
jgi:thiol-disulfide isomerase/thioredoxin